MFDLSWNHPPFADIEETRHVRILSGAAFNGMDWLESAPCRFTSTTETQLIPAVYKWRNASIIGIGHGCTAESMTLTNHFVFLVQSGDIETNHGPTLEEIMDEVRRIALDIREIKEENKATTKFLAAIHAKLDDLSNRESRVGKVEEKIGRLEQTVTNVARQIDDLENRSRRSNLIVYGINEEGDETTEHLEN